MMELWYNKQNKKGIKMFDFTKLKIRESSEVEAVVRTVTAEFEFTQKMLDDPATRSFYNALMGIELPTDEVTEEIDEMVEAVETIEDKYHNEPVDTPPDNHVADFSRFNDDW